MNNTHTITATALSKKFGRVRLFRDLSFSLDRGDSLALTGPNGSGKSTLLMITAGLLAPTSGSVEYRFGQERMDSDLFMKHCGIAAPAVNPYRELTVQENMDFVRQGQGSKDTNGFLETYGLYAHRNKHVKHLSTGMLQRLKFIIAVMNDPDVLFLDEPGSNLDESGRDAVYSYIESAKEKKIIVIATNDPEEAALCKRGISLG